MAKEDYSYFRFPQLPERSILKVDDVEAIASNWYPTGSVITTEKPITGKHFGEPYDSFTYQTTDGENTSDIKIVTVNFPPDKSIIASSTDASESVSNSQIVNIADIIPINDSVDRIKIESYDEKSDLKLNGGYLVPNLEIMRYDLEHLILNIPDKGLSDFQLSYRVGNINGYEDQVYILDLVMDGQSSLVFDSNSLDDEETVFYYSGAVKIEDGFIDKIANILVEFNFDQDITEHLDKNELIVSYGGLQLKATSLDDLNLSFPIKDNGESMIGISLTLDKLIAPLTGTIDITLIDIQGDPSKVSINNFISLPVSITNSI